MGLFKNKNFSGSGHEDYFPISIDMHSHILPGIDDGATDIPTALALIEGLQKLGIQQSIATPHIIGDMYRNNEQTISTALHQLQAALTQAGNNFKVNAAAEYQMDDYFLGLLRQKTPLLTLQDNYILTEFSWMSKPDKANEICFEIITEGYQPILAHPERYIYFHNQLEVYEDLKNIGFSLQLNLLSLIGYYGPLVTKVAKHLLKEGLISYIGTDLHHQQHLNALSNLKNRKHFQELLQPYKFLNEPLQLK